MQSERIPLDKMVLSDDVVTGLRAIIRKSGAIAYHVSYTMGESQPQMKIGAHDPGAKEHLTIEQARQLARTIRSLSERGIDIQEGLHNRLVRELLRDGIKWRP